MPCTRTCYVVTMETRMPVTVDMFFDQYKKNSRLEKIHKLEMALHFSNKIDSKLAQYIKRICCRSKRMSANCDLKPDIPPDVLPMIIDEEKQKLHKFYKKNAPYRIRTTRTTSAENPRLASIPFISESAVMKRIMDSQYLQPALLPRYFERPMIGAAFTEEIRQIKTPNPKNMRGLEDSVTKKNVVLPLKLPKLSNPFPDPVKAMTSHTTTDQEKANQMLAEARMAMLTAEKKPSASQPVLGVRMYSSKSSKPCNTPLSKCPPPEKPKCPPKAKTCPKRKLKGCAPAKDPPLCKKPQKVVCCKKQEAPYPCYSETCHVEPKETLSECHNCPWNARKNPNFKGKVIWNPNKDSPDD